MQNRLRWHLHELNPELDIPARGLDRLTVLDRLVGWVDGQPTTMVTRLAGELLGDIRTFTARINVLEAEITTLVRPLVPALLALPGVGALTAAKIVGETANVTRFRSEACFAMHAGAAPIPASSGRTNLHRLARGGNRQLNAALHRIAVTQIRLDGLGRAYYQRRRAGGDTKMEALRAFKRRLARIVFNLLKDQQPATPDLLPAAA
jgi:transposase